jgi:hypothetical protein
MVAHPSGRAPSKPDVVDELLENFPGPSFLEKGRSLLATFADARGPEGDDGIRIFIRAAQNIRSAPFYSRERMAGRLRELFAMAPAPLVYVVETNTLERAKPHEPARRSSR